MDELPNNSSPANPPVEPASAATAPTGEAYQPVDPNAVPPVAPTTTPASTEPLALAAQPVSAVVPQSPELTAQRSPILPLAQTTEDLAPAHPESPAPLPSDPTAPVVPQPMVPAVESTNAESVTFAPTTTQPEFSQTPVSDTELNLAPDDAPSPVISDEPGPEALPAQPQADQSSGTAPLISKSMILMVAAFVVMFGLVFIFGYALGRGAM